MKRTPTRSSLTCTVKDSSSAVCTRTVNGPKMSSSSIPSTWAVLVGSATAGRWVTLTSVAKHGHVDGQGGGLCGLGRARPLRPLFAPLPPGEGCPGGVRGGAASVEEVVVTLFRERQ